MAGNQTSQRSIPISSSVIVSSLPVFMSAQTAMHRTSANSGSVEGHVKDTTGLPAAHASVTLRNSLTGASQLQTTNDSGEYSFQDLPEGRYSLAVSADGLATEARAVEISGQTQQQVIDLLPEPRSSHDVVVIGDKLIIAGGWTLKGAEPTAWLDTLEVRVADGTLYRLDLIEAVTVLSPMSKEAR